MGKKLNVQVGTKIWVVPATTGRTPKEPFEDTVTKVGKKYFYTGPLDGRPTRFDLETGREAADTNYKDKAYQTLQEILDERESRELLDKVRKAFDFYNPVNLSIEQLRAIDKIINQ